VKGLGQAARRAQATPNPRRNLQRRLRLFSERSAALGGRSRHLTFSFAEGAASYLAGLVGLRGLRLALNTSVAVLVLSLPFAATAASRASSTVGTPMVATAVTAADASRAQPAARGSIAASRNPVTVAAADAHPIQEVTIHEGDTLATMANFYDVSIESIAFANGMTDAHSIQLGQTLKIPPAEGALYTVKDGDTVESVAARFKVDPSVIMSYNRVYFEPEHFAPGQLIFVRGAELPSLQPQRVTSAVLRGPSFAGAPARTGRLAWPVAGVITQYFWAGHTGTDIAAPYGTGLGADDDGVVTSTGWVAVGGLHVCIQHAGGLESCYYHTSYVYVGVGDKVARGQIVATIGLTGVTTGPHVHWECKQGNQFVSCLTQ
jgi:murein DD-endopeptidase MepM/ murein hydrolase activator NlpD